MLLTKARTRYAAHIVIAFCAAFFPLEFASSVPFTSAVLFAAIAAGARAALGALTSVNPNIGKNVV